jgi:hypothetical protein
VADRRANVREVHMTGPSDDPTDDVPDGRDLPRREPLGSPYAVPLGTLTAGAYVAVTDHVHVQPQEPAAAVPGPAVSGDID